MKMSTRHVSAMFLIAATSVIIYLPAIDNTFISDDFGLFPFLEAWKNNPYFIFDFPSELFRVMSYFYFRACFAVFGLQPEFFYLAGIALHALISILVYFL